MEFPLFEKFSLYDDVETTTTDHTIYFDNTREQSPESPHFANTNDRRSLPGEADNLPSSGAYGAFG